MDVTVITSQLTADYFIVTDDQPQWLAMLSGIFKEYQTHCKTNETNMSKYKKSLKHLWVWGNTWRYSVMNKGKVTSSVARGVSCGRILITTLLQFIRFTRDSKSLYVIGRWESPECLHSSFIGHQLFQPLNDEFVKTINKNFWSVFLLLNNEFDQFVKTIYT